MSEMQKKKNWGSPTPEGLSVVKMLATFKIFNSTDTLLQNMTKIVCIRHITFYIFN